MTKRIQIKLVIDDDVANKYPNYKFNFGNKSEFASFIINGLKPEYAGLGYSLEIENVSDTVNLQALIDLAKAQAIQSITDGENAEDYDEFLNDPETLNIVQDHIDKEDKRLIEYVQSEYSASLYLIKQTLKAVGITVPGLSDMQ